MIKLVVYSLVGATAVVGVVSIVAMMSGSRPAQQQASAGEKGDRLVRVIPMAPREEPEHPRMVQTIPATPQNQDIWPEPKPVPVPQPKPKFEDVRPIETVKPLAPWKPSKKATKPDDICARHGGWKVVTGRSWHCEYGK